MSMRRYLVPVVLSSALTATARAQTPEGAGPDVRSAAVAATRLSLGTEVRVAAGGRYLRGALAGVTDADAVVIYARDGRAVLPLAAVDTLWVRRSFAGRGARMGAVTGGIGLGALGAVAAVGLGGRGGEIVQLIGVGAAVGTAGGALLGAAVGGLVRRWERRHP